MYQLTALEGENHGGRFFLGKASFVLGKNPNADLQLKEAGVWNDHVRIEVSEREPRIRRLGEGILILNSEPTDLAVLRNGDLIQIGGAKFIFEVSPPKRRPFHVQHFLLWGMIVFIAFSEMILILWIKMR